jgi:hypothetical protein
VAVARGQGCRDRSAIRSAGGQQRFSNPAIETVLTLRLVFRLPLRQTEGFVRSILTVMGAGLDAPDHTTLSRRGQFLNVTLHTIPATGPVHLIIDSTGLSVVGEGEWAAAKHGGRSTRGWKKLHLGVDHSGRIVAQVLTEATVDDATVGIDLIGAAAGDVVSVTADAAYDTVAFYRAGGAQHARVVVPPTRTAKVSRRGPRSSARDRAPTWITSGGVNERRPPATISRPAWRTRSSATSRSSGPASGRAVQGGGASKRAWRVVFRIG